MKSAFITSNILKEHFSKIKHNFPLVQKLYIHLISFSRIFIFCNLLSNIFDLTLLYDSFISHIIGLKNFLPLQTSYIFSIDTFNTCSHEHFFKLQNGFLKVNHEFQLSIMFCLQLLLLVIY